jgi:hypothetical protein
MRASSGTPSIVPHGEEHDIYVVEHDPGPPGPVWAEADSEATGFEPVVIDLLTGRYTKPVRVVVFNVAGAGAVTPLWKSPMSCGGAATCSFATFRFSCRTSWIVTKAAIATFSCRYRCACSSASERRRPGDLAERPSIVVKGAAWANEQQPKRQTVQDRRVSRTISRR